MTDRVGDAVQAVVGKIQDAISGDTRAQLERRARQTAGQAQDAYGEAVNQAQVATAAIERGVEKQPLVTLLTGCGKAARAWR